MTVKDILKIVCEFIEQNEILSKWNASIALNTYEQNTVDFLVKCFNLVNQEIASEYLPLLCTEAVDVENDFLDFSSLSNKVLNIVSVEDENSMTLRYKKYPNSIKIFGYAKSVTYNFLPEDLTISDDVSLFNGLTARVYAYGIASEFFLVKGMSSEAQIFEERFKQGLFALSRQKGEHRMPRRRFL